MLSSACEIACDITNWGSVTQWNVCKNAVSKTEKFCVLVLDDDICLTTTVMKAIRMDLPEAEVLTARSVAEARLLLLEFKIHFFILDVNLPDGTGIHFLANLRQRFPDARVMMVTASSPAKHEQATRDLGVLLFREKPVDTKEIVKLVRSHYENMGHGTTLRHADGKFAVSLTCLSALDIIQLKCVSNATLVLQVASANGIGRICFEDGQIVHAETPTARGEAAFEEILCWKGGRIKEMTTAYQPPHTITMDWQGLLLNACQRIDENSRDKASAGISNASTPDLTPATEHPEMQVEDGFVVVATYNGQYSLPAGTPK